MLMARFQSRGYQIPFRYQFSLLQGMKSGSCDEYRDRRLRASAARCTITSEKKVAARQTFSLTNFRAHKCGTPCSCVPSDVTACPERKR
jgi:hypothetical protein